jgi:hypothetical protein
MAIATEIKATFMMPYLANILLYPVKSLDGVEVESANFELEMCIFLELNLVSVV